MFMKSENFTTSRCPSAKVRHQGLPEHSPNNNNNNNNNNNLFLIRCKLTSEYDQMHLTTTTTCNNYNKVHLRIPKIYNLKFINLTITGKYLPK